MLTCKDPPSQLVLASSAAWGQSAQEITEMFTANLAAGLDPLLSCDDPQDRVHLRYVEARIKVSARGEYLVKSLYI